MQDTIQHQSTQSNYSLSPVIDHSSSSSSTTTVHQTKQKSKKKTFTVHFTEQQPNVINNDQTIEQQTVNQTLNEPEEQMEESNIPLTAETLSQSDVKLNIDAGSHNIITSDHNEPIQQTTQSDTDNQTTSSTFRQRNSAPVQPIHTPLPVCDPFSPCSTSSISDNEPDTIDHSAENIESSETVAEVWDDWSDDILESASARRRNESLVGNDLIIPTRANIQAGIIAPIERATNKEEELSWEEKGLRWRKMRENKLKWKPAAKLLPIPNAENEETIDENFQLQLWSSFRSQLDSAPHLHGYDRNLVALPEFNTNTATPVINPLSPSSSTELTPIDIEFLIRARDGSRFMKHSKFAFPHPKLVRVDPKTGIVDWGSNYLLLTDAYKIKSNSTPHFFSIYTPTRTLTLQAENEGERTIWVQGLLSLRRRLNNKHDDQETKEDSTPSSPLLSALSPSSSTTSSLPAEFTDPKLFRQLCSRGQSMLKHGRSGKPHRRIIKIDALTGLVKYSETANCCLNLCQAWKVQPGKNTKVFSKVSHKQALPSQCFSIIWKERSLDLQVRDQVSRDGWVHGLTALMEQLQVAQAARGSLIHSRPPLPTLRNTSNASTSNNTPNASTIDEEEEAEEQQHDSQEESEDEIEDLYQNTNKRSDLLHALFQMEQEERNSNSPSSFSFTSFFRQSAAGCPVTKYSHSALSPRAGARIIKIDWIKSEFLYGERSVPLADLVSISPGKNSKIFQKVSHKLAHPACCASIGLDNRTIDLQFQSEQQRENWVEGISRIITQIRKVENEKIE